MVAFNFWAGFSACTTWLLFAIVFRYSSLSALAAATASPIAMAMFVGIEPAVIISALTVLVWVRHSENIRRLLQRTEPRIGSS